MAGAEGGRFDFDDGGSYVGEWCEGRAHGLGIATGPDNQGEYSGEWTMGFESRGVYVWPSGNIYAGGWMKGKRHGEGTQIKGRWIYRGAFTAGFCGRYGIKESLTTCAKYEGSWHLNQFDGFGVETNSDGSCYSGGWAKGMRQGLGVRKSAPYGLASENSRAVRAAQSQSSLPSAHDSDRGWRGYGGVSNGDPQERGRSETIRSGFVLRSSSHPLTSGGSLPRGMRNFRSPSPSTKKSSFRQFLMRKLRKPKSTGDLSSVGAHTVSGGSASGNPSTNRFLSAPRPGGSLRSNISGGSQFTANSVLDAQGRYYPSGSTPIFDSLDEPLTPNTTETYSGQWNEDRRSGYGVAERSDGLRYEGEWYNNKKDGFGVSYHPDGSQEEGRYKENILVQPLSKRNKLYLLRHSKLKESVEEAVKKSRELAKEAQEKAAEIAQQRAQSARSVATTADVKAEDARKLSEQARAIATEFAADFVQMGIQWEQENLYCNMLTRSGTTAASVSPADAAGSPVNGAKSNSVLPPGSTKSTPKTANNLTANSLEVSGGNRRGSFRSSFKRNQNATVTSTAKPLEKKYLSPPTVNKAEVRSPSVHQFATIQHVGDTDPKFETIDMPTETLVPPVKLQSATLHSANVVQSSPSRSVTLQTSQKATVSSAAMTPRSVEQRVAQGRPVTRAATSGQTPMTSAHMSESPFLHILGSPSQARRTRRRTLPSIMTTAPLRPAPSSRESSVVTNVVVNAQTMSSYVAGTAVGSNLGNRNGDKRFTVPGLSPGLDAAHSTENLAEPTYIIEDGIRKRVQPTRVLQAPMSPASTLNRRRQTMSSDRPETGARYSGPEERRGSGAGRILVTEIAEFDSGELYPMADAFEIEPVTDLAGGLDVSMPDVSKALMDGGIVTGLLGPRLGISGLLTREEVSRLSQQRRHEILLEMERKKRGEIVIRLADIKDWVRANIVVVLVLLINACLAFVFINLVNNAGPSSTTTPQAPILTVEEKQAAAAAAQEAIKKALRAANAAASRSRDSN